jgi:signal transduction histidine kinase
VSASARQLTQARGDRRWLAFGLSLPALAVLVHALAADRIAEPWVAWPIFLVSVGLAVFEVVPLWAGAALPGWPEVPRRWQPLGAAATAALLLPLLTVGLDVPDVGPYAGVVGGLLIAYVHVFRRPYRLPVVGWTVAVWFVVLWLDGTRELATLLLHGAGAVVVTAGSIRIADALASSTAVEAAERRRAEDRASVLAAVLRTRSLEPREVFRAVTRGMTSVGFDIAALRRVDGFARTATLLEQAGDERLRLADEVSADLGLLGVATREGREVLVDDVDRDPRAIDHGLGLRGAIVIPLFDEDEVVAVVAGASLAGPLTQEQIAAARSLAAAADRALARARVYAADRRTMVELQRLDARTQEFVSTVSHELRTPLTAMHGLGQTLRLHWEELDQSRRSDLLERIDANVERLTEMVLALLERSSLEDGGELEIVARPVPLAAGVRTLLDRLAPVSAAHPVDLDIDPGLAVEVDPALFENVLENLLMNVAIHTPEGTPVRITARPAQGRVSITVRDEGPGIPVEDLPHVLDRTYRGGPVANRAGGGLGLGLALSRQIVRAHGSDITVHSAPGEGASFRFSVPAVR